MHGGKAICNHWLPPFESPGRVAIRSLEHTSDPEAGVKGVAAKDKQGGMERTGKIWERRSYPPYYQFLDPPLESMIHPSYPDSVTPS